MNEAGKQIIRSRTKSFRDIYVAAVTQNDATAYAAGTPVKLARAISGKVSDKFSVEKIYSDDGVEDTVETYEGTDVEFEVNSLAPQDKAMLFGHLYKNGWLVKNKDDKAPEVAVGYRAKKLNGKYEFVWLYVGTFGQGYDDNYQTQEDKVTTQTAEKIRKGIDGEEDRTVYVYSERTMTQEEYARLQAELESPATKMIMQSMSAIEMNMAMMQEMMEE